MKSTRFGRASARGWIAAFPFVAMVCAVVLAQAADSTGNRPASSNDLVAQWRALADAQEPTVEVTSEGERGSVLAGAGPVVVRGVVLGDVSVDEGDVFILGKVTGDVRCKKGDVYVLGEVGGSVDVGTGNVFRSGPVGGRTMVNQGEIVTPTGASGGSIHPAAPAAGGMHPSMFTPVFTTYGVDPAWVNDAVGSYFVSFLGMVWRFGFGMLWIVIALLIAAAAPGLLEHGQLLVTGSPIRTLAVGVLWKLIYWCLAVVFVLGLLFLIGLPFLVLLIVFQWALAAVGYAILFLWAGRQVLRRLRQADQTVFYQAILVGGFLFAVLRMIPVVGDFGWWITGIFASGISVRYLLARRAPATAVP